MKMQKEPRKSVELWIMYDYVYKYDQCPVLGIGKQTEAPDLQMQAGAKPNRIYCLTWLARVGSVAPGVAACLLTNVCLCVWRIGALQHIAELSQHAILYGTIRATEVRTRATPCGLKHTHHMTSL